MPMGLEVYDANGNVIMNIDTSVVKTASVNVGVVTSPGSVNIGAYTSIGAEVIPIVKSTDGSIEPVVSVTSSSISWDARNGRSFSADIRLVML